MFLLFMKLARARDDLDQYIKSQKKDLHSARKDLEETREKWNADSRSNQRRRVKSFKWESQLKNICDGLVNQAKNMNPEHIQPVTATVEEKRLQYDKIKEAFEQNDL